MNKTAIKNFAIWARVQLMESAKQRAFEYEITETGENKAGLDSVGGRLLTATEKNQRKQLIEQIRQKGYAQVMEEAAYTWFNRFIALRFMEVNGYLPSKVRVFTDETGAFKPEILKQAMTVELEGLDRTHVLDLLDRQNNEELFKYLIITQCNALNTGLPYMFEKIANWTELLFPINLLRPDSVIGQMVSSIPEEDWTDAVQIIGWLYQYYNSELKDETFALLKKNVKITKERIPAATQLFTPDWIVRYMVENSLGRIAISHELLAFSFENEKQRIEKEKELAEKFGWKYYLPEAEQSPDVREKLTANSQQRTAMDPTTLRVLDPCMGSGHILVYAFDVLMQIYTSAGWSERDAAKSILENNLYGLDIDDRAGQLAYFAVMMKARKYNRRILNGETKPNVLSIQDSNWMTDEFIEYAAGKDAHLKADLILLRKTYKDAKEYGSILTVPPLNFAALYERIDILGRSYLESLTEAAYQKAAKDLLLPLVKQAEIMAQKYDVVVTNPPYMGSSGMSAKLGDFVKNNYPDSKSDLFAVFIERGNAMTKLNGYNCMVTMQSWMFLSSFEKMRQKLLANYTITNLMHMDNMVMHIAFGTAVSVFKNVSIEGFKGTYNQITLKDIVDDGNERPKEFPIPGNRFSEVSTSNFSKIPGSPVAYWLSNRLISSFEKGEVLKEKGDTRQGMATSDNNRFLRLWFEVDISKLGFGYKTSEEALASKKKWFPYNKGGEYRKWYGDIDYTINYEENGKEVKEYAISLYKTASRTIKSMSEYFKPCLSWSKISSGSIAFRYYPNGFIFDVAGCCIFYQSEEDMLYDFGFINSNVAKSILAAISPTLNYEAGHIASLPIIRGNSNDGEECCIVKENIKLSKEEWDFFETSWDFKRHPLL